MTSEEGVVSCLLYFNAREILNSIPFLEPVHFQNRLLGEIFKIFYESHAKGGTEDANSITEHLSDIEGVPQTDIVAIIGALAGQSITSTMAKTYAANIVKSYKQRVAKNLIERMSFTFDGVDEELTDLIGKLSDLQGIMQEESGMSLADMATMYENKYPKGEEDRGIEVGIPELDEILGGTNGGDLCFIGARPSAGKSAFANQISRYFERTEHKTGFFNLEMNKEAIYERLLASESKVTLSRIRGLSGNGLNPIEYGNLDRANDNFKKVKNLIFYNGSFTAQKIRQIVEKDKLDVVILDYLQLVKSNGRYNNRTAEVGEICHAIKAIAMDFDIPIFPLVQLNRAVEMREDKEPTLADIRESGDIEQDASQVIFLWTIPNPNDKDDISNKGCRVAKNRNGTLGSIRLKFNGELMKFEVVEDRNGKAVNKSPKETMSYGFTKALPDDQETLPFA